MNRTLNTLRLILLTLMLLCALCGQTFAQNEAVQDVVPAPMKETEDTGDGGLRLNFRGVPLDTVLEYFSKELGFIIVRETEVTGKVDVWSYQPLTKEESVDLLNTILHQKGFAAIRNGRTLLIVNRDDASQRNLPVVKEGNPENIEMTDEMVTQIIPVRYSNALRLIEDLRPLLPQYSVVSANESSNAIVLTDTKMNVRRMAEIIQALDTSISEISTLKVFILRHSDATETAQMINQLFGTSSVSGGRGRDGDRRSARNFFAFMGGGGSRGNNDDNNNNRRTERGASEARQAASTIFAVADTRTNAVVVSAPEDMITLVEEVVNGIDLLNEEPREVRVFFLKQATAGEMSSVILNMFNDASRMSSSQGRGRDRGGDNRARQSPSSQEEGTVMAVADNRTNSLVVSAVSTVMPKIEQVISDLDKNTAKEKKVYVYDLQNADAESVALLLNQMFDGQGGRTGASGGRGTTRDTTQQNTGSGTTSRATTGGQNNSP